MSDNLANLILLSALAGKVKEARGDKMKGKKDSMKKTKEEMYQRMRAKKTTPEAIEKRGLTPLMVAVYNKASDAVLQSLATPEMLNATDKKGRTALLHAALHKTLTRPFVTLLRLGADPCITTPKGFNVLRASVIGGCYDRVQLLLSVMSKEAAMRFIFPETKNNLVAVCIVNGNIPDRVKAPILSLLLSVGISPNIQVSRSPSSNNNSTALHIASRDGLVSCALVLLTAGADPLVSRKDGWTPLHLAALNGHLEIVSLLISKGADVRARLPLDVDPSKFADMTPRDLAKKEGHGKIQRLLKFHEILVTPAFIPETVNLAKS